MAHTSRLPSSAAARHLPPRPRVGASLHAPLPDLSALLEGYGHTPRFVTGENPEAVHQALAGALDASLDEIGEIQRRARTEGAVERPLCR